MSYSTLWRTLVSLTLVVMLAACGGGESNETGTETTPPTATSAPTATPEPTNTPEPTATPAESEAPQQEEESDMGMDNGEGVSVFEALGVNSYRSHIRVEATGEAFENDAGELPMGTGNIEIVGEHVAEPPAMHVTMSVGDEVFAEYIVIGDQAWSRIPFLDDNWVAASLDEVPDFNEIASPIDPNTIDDELSNIEKVGTETINGIETIHYRFDKQTLLAALDDPGSVAELQMMDSVEGDFWVTEDGIPIKWRMAFSGTGISGDNPEARGTMVTEYELSDFNADFTIEPPQEASLSEVLGIDLEVPESAVKEFQFQQSVAYTIPDMTVQDAVNFFRTQLSAQGFEADDASSYQDESSALLQFESETRLVTLSVETADDGEGVSIFIAVEEK